MPTESEFYSFIAEEKQVIETTENQSYTTKSIDRGKSYTTVKCQLDLDDFKRDMFIGFNNKSDTCAGTLNRVKPGGWKITDDAYISTRRTVELEGPTALDVINRCADVYGVCFRFDTKAKIVTIINPDKYEPVGAFITEDLNLKELNFMGKSHDLITRIYAVGKDGLTFTSINGGKSYVDNNSYTKKVISYYWKDERYTDKESLLADTKKKLKTSSIPAQSYDCAVSDLKNISPEKYGFLDFSLFAVATLIDKKKSTQIDHQVVETVSYPYYPEKNTITLSTVPPSIQSTVKSINDSLTTPNSGFQQQMQALLNTLGESISGELGGNMVITYNELGKPNGLKIMDTEDTGTAQKILWLNLSGITYSEDGGQSFESVWSFAEGGFMARWLVAGTIKASLIDVDNLIVQRLRSTSGDYKMTAWAAVFKIMEGLDSRVSIYTTKPANAVAQGIVQVFKGMYREDGTKDKDSRYGYLTAGSLGVGEKADGTYDGIVDTGTVNADTVNAATVNADWMHTVNANKVNAPWVNSTTFKVVDESGTMKGGLYLASNVVSVVGDIIRATDTYSDNVNVSNSLACSTFKFKGHTVSRTPITINSKTYNVLTTN